MRLLYMSCHNHWISEAISLVRSYVVQIDINKKVKKENVGW